MERRFIQPEGVFCTPSYTQVVTAKGGTTVYISGQVAFGESGNLVGRGDLGAQTKQVFVLSQGSCGLRSPATDCLSCNLVGSQERIALTPEIR